MSKIPIGAGKSVWGKSDKIVQHPTDDRSDRLEFILKERGLAKSSGVSYGTEMPGNPGKILVFVEPVMNDPGTERWWYSTKDYADPSVWSGHFDSSYRETLYFPRTELAPTKEECSPPDGLLYAGWNIETTPADWKPKLKQITHFWRDPTVDRLGQWDYELGLPVSITKTLMEWPGETPAAVLTPSRETTYNQLSDYLMVQTVVEPQKDDAGNPVAPTMDNAEIPSRQDIVVPPRLKSVTVYWTMAHAEVGGTDGTYISHDQDAAPEFRTEGPTRASQPAYVLRRIFDNAADAKSHADGIDVFRFKDTVQPLTIWWWYAFAGGNAVTRARTHTFYTPRCLVESDVTPLFEEKGSGGGTFSPDSGYVPVNQSGIPWNTYVAWDVKPRQYKLGYWIVDVLYVLLPNIT